jgi:hypothetical protein
LNKPRISLLRAVALFGIAAILIWQVTTRSVAAYLARAEPETALRLRSTEPAALLNLADAKLASGQSGQPASQPRQETVEPAGAPFTTVDQAGDRLRLWAELAAKTAREIPGKAADPEPKAQSEAAGPDDDTRMRVRAWVDLALSGDPLNARAVTMLGELSYVAGDETAAGRFFQVSARRSLRERVAIYWLMLKSYQERDYAAAIRHADILLRTRLDVSQDVMPLLVQMAENKDASGELKKILLDNPPWRSRLLSAVAQGSTDPRTTLDLLLAMRGARTPPTAEDLHNYVRVMVARKQYELAYYAWLEHLPPAHLTSTGLLFNGGFELSPSGVPFDWTIGQGVGVTIDIVDDPERDGRRALLIEFGYGLVEFPAVQQLTMLAPGTYHFKVRQKGELIGKRGLVWRIACTDAPNILIGESAMAVGAIPKWKDIDFEFTVPAADCRTQLVRLQLDARMPSEQLVTGSIWYDDVRILVR